MPFHILNPGPAEPAEPVASGPTSLADLSDVDITDPQPGQVLAFGEDQHWAPIAAPVSGPAAATAPGYRDAVLESLPLGFWRLHETGATPPADESGGGKTGATLLVTKGVAGIPSGGTAYRFDGGAAVTVANAPDFTAAGPFSMEAWFRTTVSHVGSLVRVDGARLAILRLQGAFVGAFGSSEYIGSSVDVLDGQWHHAVMTVSGQTLRVFVDGQERNSGGISGTGGLGAGTTLHIGSQANGANYFNGDIAEVAVYNHALTPARIAARFDLGVTDPRPSPYASAVAADAPAAWFRLGGRLAPMPGGSGIVGVTSATPEAGIPGVPGGRAARYSQTRLTRLDNMPSLTAGPFSFEWWAKIPIASSGTTYRRMLSNRFASPPASQFSFAIGPYSTTPGAAPTQKFTYYNGAADAIGPNIDDGQWHHLVATYAPGGPVRLYIDGVASVTGEHRGPVSVDTTWHVGSHGTGEYLDGTIAELAFYRTALSAERIGVHHQAGITVP